jgi:flavin reductase (DIM6/NTAB) family NADH-FMN oxidoreductase RutF
MRSARRPSGHTLFSGDKTVNVEAKRKAVRMIPYGVYVLTTKVGDRMNGAGVSWVTQASFQPPRLAVGLRVNSHIHDQVKASGFFALNIVGQGQEKEATAFFRRVEVEGDTIGGVAFEPGKTGAPLLKDFPAYLECRVVDAMRSGDHTLFLGEIVAANGSFDRKALSLSDTDWHYAG